VTIIIGEKLNGAIPRVRQALDERDEAFVASLAARQAEAGADFIDVCAGSAGAEEIETLGWMIDVVQGATDTPLCVDSPQPRTLERVLSGVVRPGLINSVSLEKDKCEVIYPLVAGTEWMVIALTCDDEGIPQDVERRVRIAEALLSKAAEHHVGPEQIFVDPLVMALATRPDSFTTFESAIRRIKELDPAVRTTSGLSNISFGMPSRRTVNQAFLTLALAAGMDSAIMDPLDREMIGALLASEALLGRDPRGRRYNRGYRDHRFGPAPAAG
jgi:5-methyltetrahydrofolate corrinoid/iron sulfur protein methyltransferase